MNNATKNDTNIHTFKDLKPCYTASRNEAVGAIKGVNGRGMRNGFTVVDGIGVAKWVEVELNFDAKELIAIFDLKPIAPFTKELCDLDFKDFRTLSGLNLDQFIFLYFFK